LRILLATAVGLSIGLGVLVWTRTQIVSLHYSLTRQLRGEVEKLRVEAAALSGPQRIETKARSLGLRYPGPRQVVRLPAGDVAAGAPE
jgi:cell division protein FtsL